MPDSRERKIIKYGEEPEEGRTADATRIVEKAAPAEEDEDFGAPDVPGYFVEPEPAAEDDDQLSPEERDARIEARRRSRRSKRIRKKWLTIILMVLAFSLLATMCGKDIVRLKAENVALKRQQVALKKERDELKAELESTSEQEYIRDQARKQLRLLNPGELLFIWDE